MSKKSELAKNTIIIGIGKGITQLLSLALVPFYAYYLSPSEFGLYDLVSTYVLLLGPVLSLQMEMGVFRLLIDSRKEPERAGQIVSSSLLIASLAALLSVVVGLIIYAAVGSVVMLVSGLYLMIFIFFNFLLQAARGLGKNKIYATIGVSRSVFLVACLVIFVVFGEGTAVASLVAITVATFASALILAYSLRIWRYISIGKVNKKTLKYLLSYSLPLVPNGAAIWGINMANRTIVVVMLGMAANGIFAISNKFALMLTSLFSILYLSWTESVSLHIGTDDEDRFVSKFFNTAAVGLTLLAALLVVSVGIIFDFIIAEEFSESYMYVPPLVASALLGTIMSLYGSVYIGLKATKTLMYSTIVSAVLSIALTVAFISVIGLYGAAIATAIAYLIMIVYRHFDLLKRKVYIKYESRIIGIVLAMSLLSGAFYYANDFIFKVITLVLFVGAVCLFGKDLVFSIIKKKV